MDADPGFVGLKVLRGKKAGFVGGHHRQFEPLRKRNRPPQARFLVLAARALRLQVEAIPKTLRQDAGGVHSAFVVIAQERSANLGIPRSGERDEAIAAVENFRGGHGTVMFASHVGQRGELNQVAVAHRTAGDHRQAQRLSRISGLVRQVHPNDRLDPCLEAGAIELDQPEQVAVVGEANGAHAELGGAARQVVDASEAINDGVLAAGAQMDKLNSAHRTATLPDYLGGSI